MTSPLHGEDPGFKSPWAHTVLLIIADPVVKLYNKDRNKDAHARLFGLGKRRELEILGKIETINAKIIIYFLKLEQTNFRTIE